MVFKSLSWGHHDFSTESMKHNSHCTIYMVSLFVLMILDFSGYCYANRFLCYSSRFSKKVESSGRLPSSSLMRYVTYFEFATIRMKEILQFASRHCTRFIVIASWDQIKTLVERDTDREVDVLRPVLFDNFIMKFFI